MSQNTLEKKSVNNHDIAKAVCKAISEEFIKRNMYGVCLPATLLAFELLKNIGAKLTCGQMTYKDKVTAPIHFWIELDEVVYDPTIEINRHHTPEITPRDINSFEHYRGIVEPQDFEDELMIHTFFCAKISGDVNFYFQQAPSYLRKIRYEIKCRYNEIGEE